MISTINLFFSQIVPLSLSIETKAWVLVYTFITRIGRRLRPPFSCISLRALFIGPIELLPRTFTLQGLALWRDWFSHPHYTIQGIYRGRENGLRSAGGFGLQASCQQNNQSLALNTWDWTHTHEISVLLDALSTQPTPSKSDLWHMLKYQNTFIKILTWRVKKMKI